MIDRLTLTGRITIVLAGAALLVLVPGAPAALGVPVAVAFFVIGPGLAWTFALPVDGPIERGAIAVALSLTLDVLVAEALLLIGLTGALPAAGVLAAVAVAGALAEARRPAQVAPEPEAVSG